MNVINDAGYPTREDIPQEEDFSGVQEADKLELHEFSLDLIDEAIMRGLSIEELRSEVQQEVLIHTPVVGKTLFNQ